MPQQCDRGRVVFSTLVYATALASLVFIKPENFWFATVYKILVFSFVLLFSAGVAVLVFGAESNKFLKNCSFRPKLNRAIHGASMAACGCIMVYVLMSLLPMLAYHRTEWKKYVDFQCEVVKAVEGHKAAERFWNRCHRRLGQIAVNAETDGNLTRAFDFYKQYESMSSLSQYEHVACGGALGRILDKSKNYIAANAEYEKTEGTADENSGVKLFISHARLIRMFTFVPEKAATREFPFMDCVAWQKEDSALSVGESYQEVDLSKLNDYQKRLMHCVFHPEDPSLKPLPRALHVVSFIDTKSERFTRRQKRKNVLCIMLNPNGAPDASAGVQ